MSLFVFSLLLFCIIKIAFADWIEYYTNDTGLDNPYFCENMKKCVPLQHCPEMVSMMNQISLPVHRFRQIICGYIGTNPKVCCDFLNGMTNYLAASKIQNDHILKENSDCGTSMIRSNIDTLGTYPFVARIGFINLHSGAIKYSCTGTIINQRNILTTATCALIKSSDYKLYTVLLGDYNSSTDPDCNALFCGHKAKHYNVSYIIKHPSFNSNTFTSNIALLRLNTVIDFTVTTQPICLSTTNNLSENSAMLIGWGKISNSKDKSNVQQALKLTLLPNQECSKFTNQGLSVELCATGLLEPCSGYSGSPLVQKYRDKFVLIGLLSYGTNCIDQQSSPSIYVDIGKYTNWIKENS